MRGKWFVAGLLAAVGVLAWGGSSRGGDTIRLNMGDNTPTKSLVDDGRGADTIRTWHHHGFGWGGWGGGWGGWGGWGYRGLGWGGWGYRGLGWGGLGYGGLGWGGLGWGGLGYRGLGLGWGGMGLYRPYYGFGLGYGGLGFGGLGYGLGMGRFGFGGFFPGFGISYGGSAGLYSLNMPAGTPGSPLPGAAQPNAPAPPHNEGTFPYDGGPSNPVPNPKDTPPSSTTPRSVPLEGRAVSLPKAAPKWNYPAYGERARRTTPASERTYLTRGEQK